MKWKIRLKVKKWMKKANQWKQKGKKNNSPPVFHKIVNYS